MVARGRKKWHPRVVHVKDANSPDRSQISISAPERGLPAPRPLGRQCIKLARAPSSSCTPRTPHSPLTAHLSRHGHYLNRSHQALRHPASHPACRSAACARVATADLTSPSTSRHERRGRPGARCCRHQRRRYGRHRRRRLHPQNPARTGTSCSPRPPCPRPSHAAPARRSRLSRTTSSTRTRRSASTCSSPRSAAARARPT